VMLLLSSNSVGYLGRHGWRGLECIQHPASCPIFSTSSAKMRKMFLDNIHLFKYYHTVDRVPVFLEQLSRGEAEAYSSILYPIGDPIFIHILSRGGKERRLYIPVEPEPPKKDPVKLSEEVERRLATLVGERFDYKTLDEKREKLLAILKKVVVTSNRLAQGTYIIGEDKIYVSRDVWTYLEYTTIRDMVGVGKLEPMIRDPYIEDISIPGAGPVFLEHKVFESCESSVTFELGELKDYAERVSQIIGRPVSLKRPITDGSLPDGSRINIVYAGDVSLRGPNITIRKFSPIPLSIVELCRYNSLDYTMAAYLWMLFDNNLNVWFCGETASGKTTLLNACLAFIPFNNKIVSIEDTPEVVTPHANWVRECTREGEGSTVSLFDLLRAALRQRPNYIIVGEIRGREGNVAFQAMQTGHGVIATFHAGSVEKLIQRLTGQPLEIPKTYIDNLNAVTIQSAVRHPKTGKLVRRVLGIYEILGYDPVSERFQFIEVFGWDPVTDTFNFRGVGSSTLLEEKIAVRKGISRRELRKIYEELEKRAEILRIADYAGIRNYYQLFELFKEVRLLGPDEVLKRLRTGEIPMSRTGAPTSSAKV